MFYQIEFILHVIAAVYTCHFQVLFGEKDIFSSSDAKYFVEFLCQRETTGAACNDVLTLLFGYDPKNLNEVCVNFAFKSIFCVVPILLIGEH